MLALIVDDSRTTRRIIAGIFHELGFETLEAGDGRQALEALRTSATPRCMVVDWNMPDVDGLTFVEKVRADPAYGDVPIIMVTTESEKAQVVRALSMGANEYLMKPFTREMVIEKLALVGIGEGV
jgi:two-component system chemotaxis response regulator CheY